MSNTTPGTPNQQAITIYDDDSNHHIGDDTVWTYNGCTFKRITKKEADGSIVELRNGGVLSCPICPEIGVMTTLSNLIGHLVAKNHAQRFYHLWSLRGSGNNNAEPMLLFQDSWETANHLKVLRSKRLEKIDRAVIAQGEYNWNRLKTRFNCMVEGHQNGGQAPHPGRLFMPEFDMLHKFKGVDNHIGGSEWSKLFKILVTMVKQLTWKGRIQPHHDRLLGTRTYQSNRGISSVRTSGQQIVTSVFRQAKEKMTGAKGPLSEIVDNPRKRRAPEENEAAVFKVPKRPYLCSDSVIRTDQTTNNEDGQAESYESPKVTEGLTPEEEEGYKNYQQLCFLLDTFQEMENGENSGTHSL
ncbi:hypothetical protein TWF191_005909 [Orbilia oligospora]|uniref:Uncharacterized protein n=1 Tax=Orbilia oligospora TaxID=2813651 RepID=A0A7C8V4B6_ORBOL|nr:hypothetical protein TWF191_005909 [Orbilia oligospora]